MNDNNDLRWRLSRLDPRATGQGVYNFFELLVRRAEELEWRIAMLEMNDISMDDRANE